VTQEHKEVKGYRGSLAIQVRRVSKGYKEFKISKVNPVQVGIL
jgi:hypothetical protein